VPVAARLRGALRVHHWAPLRLGFAGLVVVLVVVVVILVLRQRRRRSAPGRRLLPPPLDRAPLDDRHELVAETREVSAQVALARRLLPVPVAARLRGALRVHHWAPLRLGFAGLVVVLVVVVILVGDLLALCRLPPQQPPHRFGEQRDDAAAEQEGDGPREPEPGVRQGARLKVALPLLAPRPGARVAPARRRLADGPVPPGVRPAARAGAARPRRPIGPLAILGLALDEEALVA